MPQEEAERFALSVRVEGEVRDAAGNLISTTEAVETVEVSIEELAAFSDEKLREAGLDEAQINHIRSAS